MWIVDEDLCMFAPFYHVYNDNLLAKNINGRMDTECGESKLPGYQKLTTKDY